MQEVADIPATDLPDVPKGKNQPEGSGAAVDLMKVLLKLISERHGVAARSSRPLTIWKRSPVTMTPMLPRSRAGARNCLANMH